MPERDSEPTTIRRDFPHAAETVDPDWIALEDGTRIACTLWRPVTDAKVPVMVEMVPYRRRDGTVFRDMELHPYIAGHGIACCRADLRGSGDSDGLLQDDYLPQEQEDACANIAQLAAQAWCNGKVGMTGISWGGYGITSPDPAIDRRREDRQSLCFDTAPMEADLALLGAAGQSRREALRRSSRWYIGGLHLWCLQSRAPALA